VTDARLDERVYHALESLMLELPLEDKEFWERLKRRTGCEFISWFFAPYPRYIRVPDTLHISYGDVVRVTLVCKDRYVFVTLYDLVHVYSFRVGKGWIIYYRI
jgi:hypothetical protein